MQALLIDYFAAEQQESLLFMAVSVAAMIASIYLVSRGGRYRGMIYPLAAIAAIQFGVGATIYLRTGPQVAVLSAQLREQPQAFKAQETARMSAVMRSFEVYRLIESTLLLVGVVLALGLRRNPLWHAVGLGLIVQCAILLLLDGYAQQRAVGYLAAIGTLP